ncbi:MAG: class I SAM-dependent methyltransferase [Comamonadaceae bacterium]
MPALAVWAAAWLLYKTLLAWAIPATLAMLLACLLGMVATGVARWRGSSHARQLALALGFPISALLSSAPSASTWLWLLPLALALLVYPMHTWGDAPVFPTPLQALRQLPTRARLATNALVLDAGCGAGDGLKALHLAYPKARCVGIEFSRPLRWVAALRCPWAQVRLGDIWREDWQAYDMVYLFQRPETMPRAVAKARAEMRPGSWLVSLEFAATDLQPTALVYASPDRPIWLYQSPFKFAERTA